MGILFAILLISSLTALFMIILWAVLPSFGVILILGKIFLISIICDWVIFLILWNLFDKDYYD